MMADKAQLARQPNLTALHEALKVLAACPEYRLLRGKRPSGDDMSKLMAGHNLQDGWLGNKPWLHCTHSSKGPSPSCRTYPCQP